MLGCNSMRAQNLGLVCSNWPGYWLHTGCVNSIGLSSISLVVKRLAVHNLHGGGQCPHGAIGLTGSCWWLRRRLGQLRLHD